jgi:protein TonB
MTFRRLITIYAGTTQMSYAASYASSQRDPRRHIGGIAFVIVFHVLLAWGLANGLARDVVKIFKDPLDVRLIEEVKPVEPPPPPPPPPPPTRKIQAQPRPAPPPPAYVPPPEVQVQATIEPVIAVVQHEPPPPAPPAPVAPPEPVVAAIGITCPNHLNIRSSVAYPPQALRLNKSGEVLVEFIVDADGKIGDVRIARSSDPVFNRAVTDAVTRFRCVGQGRPVRVTVPFQFALD